MEEFESIGHQIQRCHGGDIAPVVKLAEPLVAPLSKVAPPAETVALTGKAHPVGGAEAKSSGRKASPWIAHIKATQAKEHCSYKEAMIKAKATWKK